MFNLHKTIKAYISLMLVLLLAGCDKDFEQLNINPNLVSKNDFNPAFLFPPAQYGVTNDYYTDAFYGSAMVQHFSTLLEGGSSWTEGDKYIYHKGHNEVLWLTHYDVVKNLVDIIESTRELEQYNNLHQMARIWKVLTFQRLTDVYGDLPYSEAGLAYYKQMTRPQYVKQKDIYAYMLNELDDAVNKLRLDQRDYGEFDIFYEGDLAKWKKLGNTLMLRLGMRLSKVQPAEAEKWVKKAYSKGLFESNNDNLLVKFPSKTTVGYFHALNWLMSQTGTANSGKLAKTFVDFLKSHNDPRLQYTAGVYSNPQDPSTGNLDPAVQKGMPSGLTVTSIVNDPSYDPNDPLGYDQYSGIRRDVYSKLDGVRMLVTYAETQFLLAEAATRGWISGNARDFYNNGVKGAMKMLSQYDPIASISDDEITTYLNNYPFVGTGNKEAAIEQISTQYWAAALFIGIEAWSNWRRTGYPKLIPTSYISNETNGQIPRRLIYPDNELALNGEKFKEAIARQGPDTFMTRVWWDK